MKKIEAESRQVHRLTLTTDGWEKDITAHLLDEAARLIRANPDWFISDISFTHSEFGEHLTLIIEQTGR